MDSIGLEERGEVRKDGGPRVLVACANWTATFSMAGTPVELIRSFALVISMG